MKKRICNYCHLPTPDLCGLCHVCRRTKKAHEQEQVRQEVRSYGYDRLRPKIVGGAS